MCTFCLGFFWAKLLLLRPIKDWIMFIFSKFFYHLRRINMLDLAVWRLASGCSSQQSAPCLFSAIFSFLPRKQLQAFSTLCPKFSDAKITWNLEKWRGVQIWKSFGSEIPRISAGFSELMKVMRRNHPLLTIGPFPELYSRGVLFPPEPLKINPN